MMNAAALLADLVMVVHFSFLAFVILGALVARRRAWLRRLHLVALAYAVLNSTFRWVCPLTYLEGWLRSRAGQPVDERSFLARLLEPVIYADLPPGAVLAAAVLVLAGSLAAYYPLRRRADR